MRRPLGFAPGPTPRLRRRQYSDRDEWWSLSAGDGPPVYGERWEASGGATFRQIDPNRSKLGAALVRGFDGPLPQVGESWLYLGAASGTTASHVADLVGPAGAVFALEKSLRPFSRLLGVADRWENLLPVLADVRAPEEYADLVGPVDGIYADVSQPDQVGLVLANAEWFLRDGDSTSVIVALKTPSLGRGQSAAAHLREAEERLTDLFELEPPVRLDPFHKGHYMLAGRRGRPPARRSGPRVVRTPREGFRGPRRR